jgi:hypothetical protein
VGRLTRQTVEVLLLWQRTPVSRQLAQRHYLAEAQSRTKHRGTPTMLLWVYGQSPTPGVSRRSKQANDSDHGWYLDHETEQESIMPAGAPARNVLVTRTSREGGRRRFKR